MTNTDNAVFAGMHYVLGRRTAQIREDNLTDRYTCEATSQLTGTEVGRVIPNTPQVTSTYTTNALNQYASIATQVSGLSPQVSALAHDANGNLLNDGKQAGEYIHGIRTDEILRAEISNGTNAKTSVIYPLADGLGSTVALVDGRGKVTDRYRYTAYGTPTALTTSYQVSNSTISGYRFLFTGREWLVNADLNDHRNRYCSLTLAHWLTTDPIGFRGNDINLYRYSHNAPVGFRDLFGLKACFDQGSFDSCFAEYAAQVEECTQAADIAKNSCMEAAQVEYNVCKDACDYWFTPGGIPHNGCLYACEFLHGTAVSICWGAYGGLAAGCGYSGMAGISICSITARYNVSEDCPCDR